MLHVSYDIVIYDFILFAWCIILREHTYAMCVNISKSLYLNFNKEKRFIRYSRLEIFYFDRGVTYLRSPAKQNFMFSLTHR